jgi:hypothetical protein
MALRNRAAGFRRIALLLLLAACAGCSGGDSCTSKGDCNGGEVCAGPQQGPFRCYEDCSHSSCPGGTTCTTLTAAGGSTTMACLPNTP